MENAAMAAAMREERTDVFMARLQAQRAEQRAVDS
jgi:hypothetical protein